MSFCFHEGRGKKYQQMNAWEGALECLLIVLLTSPRPDGSQKKKITFKLSAIKSFECVCHKLKVGWFYTWPEWLLEPVVAKWSCCWSLLAVKVKQPLKLNAKCLVTLTVTWHFRFSEKLHLIPWKCFLPPTTRALIPVEEQCAWVSRHCHVVTSHIDC